MCDIENSRFLPKNNYRYITGEKLGYLQKHSSYYIVACTTSAQSYTFLTSSELQRKHGKLAEIVRAQIGTDITTIKVYVLLVPYKVEISMN